MFVCCLDDTDLGVEIFFEKRGQQNLVDVNFETGPEAPTTH